MKSLKPASMALLSLVIAFLLSACGQTVMTVKAPSSPDIESELTMILDNIILDDADPSVTYKKGFYQLKMNRDLESWEKMALRGIMETAVSSEGFQELPSLLKLRILEEDPDVLELLHIEKGQIFECPFSQSKLAMVKGRIGEQEIYKLGAVVNIEVDLPELEYEMGINSEASEALGEAMQSLLDTMRSFGPMKANYELSVSDGKKDLVIDSSLEAMRHSQFISAGVIQSNIANPYGLSGNMDFKEGLEDFYRSGGFSEAFVSGLLFPALSRDADAYDFPKKKS